MTFIIGDSDAVAAIQALVARFDLGTANPTARIQIYSGTRPTVSGTGQPGPDAPLTDQVLLCECNMSNPAFAAVADNNGAVRAVPNPISTGTVVAAGTATFYRIVDRDGVARAEGSVGTSGANLNLTSVTFTLTPSPDTVDISAFAIQMATSSS